jgi:hypothetical protein
MTGSDLQYLVGTVVRLDATDYLYGVEPLVLRIQRITPLVAYPGWAWAYGVRVDGRSAGHEARDAIVRIAALPV